MSIVFKNHKKKIKQKFSLIIYNAFFLTGLRKTEFYSKLKRKMNN